MIKYEFLEKGKFLIVRFTGIIRKEYLISFIKFIFTVSSPEILSKVLCDFRYADLAFSHHDMGELIEIQKMGSRGSYNVRQVFLVNNPKDTTLSTLFSINYKEWTTFICSTMTYCVAHLSLALGPKELEDKLDELTLSFIIPVDIDSPGLQI